MSDSNNNNSRRGKKRFWPFGRKSENKNAPDNAPNSGEQVKSTSAETMPAEVAESVFQKNNHTEDRGNQVDVIQALQEDERAGMVASMATEIENKQEAPDKTISDKTIPDKTVPSKPEKTGFFSRIRAGLTKTRKSFIGGVSTLLMGAKKIDDNLLEELEMQLITADIGIESTTEIIANLTSQLKRRELNDANALMASLKTQLTAIIKHCSQPLIINKSNTPFVILVVGVNGVGKTTTIGKLAYQLQQQRYKVMLAAGDTFRAAAVEQLQEWGKYNDIPVISQGNHADSASVIYDAFEAARARRYDVLIADTAGRLHNKEHLMNELKKVKRVLTRLDGNAPHETMLVIDAGTGQNAINQATLFDDAVGLTGMTLTKLDGTAKGGSVFALAKKMQLPIRFLGVGERIDDLRPFSAEEFVDALFSEIESKEEMLESNDS